MDLNQPNKELIVICGPTASGKTRLAIDTAKKLNTVILSADSRQFYQEMSIGTAKPTAEELAEVKHYFINTLSIEQDYSAGDFESDALQLLNELYQTYDKVVVAGGSGLYIRALCDGFDNLPKAENELRDQLKQELEKHGVDFLAARLQELDPEYAAQVDLANPQRVIRALEVIETSGQKFSALRKKQTDKRPFTIKKYGIDWPREKLYERINLRVDIMLQEGLENEVRGLYDKKHLNALQTVGYSELFDYFDEKIDREEAIRLIKRNTRRYAKRQMTWFRREEGIIWLEPGENIV